MLCAEVQQSPGRAGLIGKAGYGRGLVPAGLTTKRRDGHRLVVATPAPAPAATTLRQVAAPVFLAGLGYFVDIFDLLLFSIVRVSSLNDLGAGARTLEAGALLLNLQLVGMMIGGVAWGMLADRRGRLSVLFGSIFLYSAASLANGFVTTVAQYAALRFVAGFGLAGELGAGLTLVVELLPPKTRGAAATLVSSMGVAGAVTAALVSEWLSWRSCMVLGGVMGFGLFALRLGVRESPMFSQVLRGGGERGNFLRLLTHRGRFLRYARCVMIGIPIWFATGVLVTLAPELAQALGVGEKVEAGRAVMWFFALTTAGNFTSGMLSQMLRSRRRAAALYLLSAAAGCAVYLSGAIHGAATFYAVCAWMGFSCGYWAVTIMMAVEEFGTDLRATVGTSVPTFIRSAAVPMLMACVALKTRLGVVGAVAVVGALAFGGAAWALARQRETYGKPLDFREIPGPG